VEITLPIPSMSKFDKYIPGDILKPYIKYFAISENENEQTYKVLPDTSLVMGFQYKGRLSQLTDGNENKLSTAGITGLQDRFRIFKNIKNTGTILIYFNEARASFFFTNPLHELFSQSLSLDNLIPKSVLDNLEECLFEAQYDKQRINLIEQFLICRLQFSETDLLVTSAIQLIHQSKGTIRMMQLAEKLNISQSPLEKRFRKIVGASPKKFASIVRLQSVINKYPENKNMTALGYESGYYDQAHFIKDFRLFTGETPEKFFLKK
jgi:AraC-like DNA-binding protein